MDATPVRVELGLEALPPAVGRVVERLEAAGHASYVVGGGVRDLLGRRSPGDFDVATAASPAAVLALFPRAIPIGRRHGTVMVPTPDGPVDVTRFRAGDSLADDLAHRDFTINAIAWHPLRREIVDPHDGRGDLAKGCLRAVGDADARFAEDPLRCLRGVRLAAQLELALAEGLVAAMGRAAARLDGVARERVRHELSGLLLSSGAGPGLALLRATGIEAALAPGVRADAADVVAALPAELELRLAGWLRDTKATAILRQLRFARRTSEAVASLLRAHPVGVGVDTRRDPEVRRMLKRVGPERVASLLALRRAEIGCLPAAAAEPEQRAVADLEAALARIEAAGRAALQRQDLALDGSAVMEALGRGPGPHIGRALAYLTDRVLEDPSQNTPERLRSLLEDFANTAGKTRGEAS